MNEVSPNSKGNRWFDGNRPHRTLACFPVTVYHRSDDIDACLRCLASILMKQQKSAVIDVQLFEQSHNFWPQLRTSGSIRYFPSRFPSMLASIPPVFAKVSAVTVPTLSKDAVIYQKDGVEVASSNIVPVSPSLNDPTFSPPDSREIRIGLSIVNVSHPRRCRSSSRSVTQSHRLSSKTKRTLRRQKTS